MQYRPEMRDMQYRLKKPGHAAQANSYGLYGRCISAHTVQTDMGVPRYQHRRKEETITTTTSCKDEEEEGKKKKEITSKRILEINQPGSSSPES